MEAAVVTCVPRIDNVCLSVPLTLLNIDPSVCVCVCVLPQMTGLVGVKQSARANGNWEMGDGKWEFGLLRQG